MDFLASKLGSLTERLHLEALLVPILATSWPSSWLLKEKKNNTENAEATAETALAVPAPKDKEEKTIPNPKEKKEDQSKDKEEEQNAKKTNKAKTKKKKPAGKPRAKPSAMKLVKAEGKNWQLQRRRQSRKKRPEEIMVCAFLQDYWSIGLLL